MSTPNNLTVPAEMPPAAPADLVAKRDHIIAELEKAAKDASGTLQQVLRKMVTLLASTKPGAPYNPQSLQDVKDAFTRYSQDPEAVAKPRPAILMESVEWMQAYLASRGFPVAGAAPAASAPAASKPASAAKGAKDSFESGGSQHARSLGGDVPVPPGQPNKEQEQLESMKSWMLNPGLGKVKG
ncbi:hypothetical protein F0U60_17305 [Archangium minus]|uniref:Uncharacterized protein n=1 Tax=Archangium minus TaxID=83450 RepID=A0ABY9WPC8_9BACT|nr:hypothetical protein F0U60_17305 [Archangium minus]